MPWRRKWQPIPLFLPGKSHGQRSPGGLQSMGSQRVRHSLATKQQQHKPEAGSWEPWSPPEFPDSLQHRAEAQGFSPGLSDPFHSRLCFSTHLIPGCVGWAWLCQMLLRPWAGESVGAECSRPGKAVFFSDQLSRHPHILMPHVVPEGHQQLTHSFGNLKALKQPRKSGFRSSLPPHLLPWLLAGQCYQVILSNGTRKPQRSEGTPRPLFLAAGEVSIESPSQPGRSSSSVCPSQKAALFLGGDCRPQIKLGLFPHPPHSHSNSFD